jgi:hypothetical protein
MGWGLVWLHCAPSRACVASFETLDAKGQADLPGVRAGAPEQASALGASLRSGQALRDAPPIRPRLRALIESEAPGEEPARLGSCGRPEMAPQRIEKIESAPGNGAPMERRPDRDERVGGSAAADRRTVLRRRQAAAQHPAWELQSLGNRIAKR